MYTQTPEVAFTESNIRGLLFYKERYPFMKSDIRFMKSDIRFMKSDIRSRVFDVM